MSQNSMQMEIELRELLSIWKDSIISYVCKSLARSLQDFCIIMYFIKQQFSVI